MTLQYRTRQACRLLGRLMTFCLAASIVAPIAARANEAPPTDPTTAVAQVPAPAGAAEVSPAPQGFLWNISSQPFSFRVRRVRGVSWSEVETLMPGEKRERRPGDEHDIFGLTAGINPRFIIVRYPAHGGLIEERLSSRTSSRSEALMPFHYIIDDGYGAQSTVQAESLAKAEAAQAALRAKRSESYETMHRRLWQVGMLILHPVYYGFDGLPGLWATSYGVHGAVPGLDYFPSGCCGCLAPACSVCCGP